MLNHTVKQKSNMYREKVKELPVIRNGGYKTVFGNDYVYVHYALRIPKDVYEFIVDKKSKMKELNKLDMAVQAIPTKTNKLFYYVIKSVHHNYPPRGVINMIEDSMWQLKKDLMSWTRIQKRAVLLNSLQEIKDDKYKSKQMRLFDEHTLTCENIEGFKSIKLK